MSHNPRPPRREELSARRAALRVLLATSGDLLFDVAFDRELQRRPLPRRDRALARNMATGTLKLRRRLDFIIDRFLESRRPLPGPIRQVLRLGTYQLTELSRVPRFAAVSTSVELAKLYGHAGTARLVNAVLRRISAADGDWPWPDRAGDLVQHLGTVYSYPNWLIRHWLSEHGVEQAERLCKLGNRPAGLTLRLVTAGEWTEALLAPFEQEQLETRPGRWFPEYRFIADPPPLDRVPAVASGELTVQNEAAAAAVYLLGLKPGDTCLEVGAAPGGKASMAARCVESSGRVLALDINARRLRRLRENVTRLNQPWIAAIRADGCALPAARVDRILIDAPCSGLGLLHRHPDLRWQKDISDIERLAELQYRLVQAGIDALRPGGRLVYSTCTTTRAENEGVIARVLESRQDVTVVDPRPLLPAGLGAGASWVEIVADPPRLDGAFACALERVPDGP